MELQSDPPGASNPNSNTALSSLSLDRNDTLTRSGNVQGSLGRRTSGFDGAKAAFWKETLQGKAPELGLPADKPKKSNSRVSGAQQVRALFRRAANVSETVFGVSFWKLLSCLAAAAFWEKEYIQPLHCCVGNPPIKMKLMLMLLVRFVILKSVRVTIQAITQHCQKL